jgi:hypothetical protein
MASPISLRNAVYVMWDQGACNKRGALGSASRLPLVRRVLIEELVERIEPRHWTRRWHKGALFIDRVVSMPQAAKDEKEIHAKGRLTASGTTRATST